MSSILVKALGATLVGAGMLYKKRFDRDAERAPAINEATLLDILRINQRTEYGERHGFSRIRSAADYRRAVPLATYEHFRDAIDRIAAGEQNLLTADRIAHLGLSSGTTGAQKMIPITARAKRIIAQNMMLFTQGVLAETVPASRRGGRGMILLSSVVPTRTPGGLLAGPGTSIGMKSMARVSSMFWSSPPEVYEVKSQSDAHYLHLLFGLAERDLQYISAPFASGVLDLFHALEKHAPALVRDLGQGTIREELALEPGARRALCARLRPDPARARELERIFAQGFEAVAPRAFPAMSHITTVTSAGFGVYAERLERYIGDLPVYSAVYGATEAVLGIGLGPGRPRYVITPRTAFFEFIPESAMDEESPPSLLYGELTPGERYEIVVTTYSGLYRYRMGDVVEVLEHHRRAPVIDFLYRRGGLLNLVGEKTSEQAAREALSAALSREGHELVDFSTMADMESTPERYVFFLELRRPLGAEARGRLEALLEDALCGANPVYDASRISGKLAPCSLRLVREGTFRELQDRLIARGASPSQVKVPRVLRDDTNLRLLFERTLIAEGTEPLPSFMA